jgi:hypothetical protein
MRCEYEPRAIAHEGVFGPEVVLNARSGVFCLRSLEWSAIAELPAAPLTNASMVTIDELPSAPLTNAFMVWIGFPVLIVSEGVQRADVAAVAARLREGLEAPELPVCFAISRDQQRVQTVVSDNPALRPPRELARAEVYVQAQMAWEEAELVVVHLDGQRFELRLGMVPVGDGTYTPLVE